MTHQTSAVRSLSVADNQDWRTRAACRTGDPEQFYGPNGTVDSKPDSDKPLQDWEVAAKRICLACPSLAPCQAWVSRAERNQTNLFGVVAGMAARERLAARDPAAVTGADPEEEVEDERTRTVRQLAATGMSDPEIATVIDRSTKTVQDIRRRAGIPPGLPQGRNRRAS